MARKVTILGGTGRMGKWFSRFFRDRGFSVIIYSRSPERAALVAGEIGVRYEKSRFDAIHNADIVLISIPIGVTAKVIREISGYLKAGTILFDIASIKGEIIKALKEANALGIRTISVHPLFGPGAKSIDGKRVLVIPVSEDSDLIKEISEMFKGATVQIVRSGEEHDMMMALTLCLPHFLNIVFGKTLLKADIRDLKKFGGTTFTLQLMIAEAVLSEDPELYYEIQRQNKVFTKVLDNFAELVKESALAVKDKNRALFLKDFEKVKTSFSKDPEFMKAYEKFYKAFEAIQP